MLIYGDSGNTPFDGVSSYKSAHKRKRASNRVKALKRGGQTKNKRRTVSKKVKKRRSRRIKKLSAKNLKFLKNLGLRVKKN